MLFVMVGGRQDARQDYDEILRVCDELKVSAHPVMATPFPGTELYDTYREHLVPGLDWDSYDGNHAVFEHPTMTVREREDLIIDLRARLFTIPRILKRVTQVGWRGFPMSHVTSWMIQYPQGRAFKQYAREHRALALAAPAPARLTSGG
jgi:hypothetical protein